jgi:hypothetical protein
MERRLPMVDCYGAESRCEIYFLGLTCRFLIYGYWQVNQLSALWDQGYSGHHNRYVLDKLWVEVAQELSCTSKYNSFSQPKHISKLQERKNMTKKVENLGKMA